MTISSNDFDKLCDIARRINDLDETQEDLFEIWEDLNDVIGRIK